MANHRLKTYLPHTTYHVYNRGAGKQDIFLDDIDRATLIGNIARLHGPGPHHNRHGHPLAPLEQRVSVLAYCLMPNHYHLVVHQYEQATALETFMRRVMLPYSKQFNYRHQRSGRLCQERFRAELITTPQQLRNEIIYVHLNPAKPLEAKWSSHQQYLDQHPPANQAWCRADLGLKAFGGRGAYLEQLHTTIRDRAETV